jgi:predicted nucleotidyltransferase
MSEPEPSVPEAYRRAIDLLDAERVLYVLVGGLAAGLQGQPRVTRDVDFMITLASQRVWHLTEAARKEGFDVDPHEAELHWEASGFIRLWLGPPGKQVAVDLMACKSEFLREAAWRATQAQCMGRRVPIATPEDMILFKLSAYREKDIPDLRAIFLRHEKTLDREYLRRWAQWFTTRNEHFREMPPRLELLLERKPLPAGRES